MNLGDLLRNRYRIEKALAAQKALKAGVLPQSPSQKASIATTTTRHPARRVFLKWLLCGGTGVIGSVAFSQLGKNSSTSLAGSLPTAATATKIVAVPSLAKIQFASVKLNRYGKIVDRPVRQAQIFMEDLGNGTSLKMVKIPAGKFMMGSPASEEARNENEGPRHQVKVSEFYLGQTLVTQGQWQALMGSNPSKFQGDGELPVDSVSWLAAMDFCQKLSQKTSRTYRLPSEAEWEYACRAGTTTPFAFGETITSAVANYDGNYTYKKAAKGKYRQKTTVVGSFPANLFGLYDMHGNLWEWCLDEWSDNYQNAATEGRVNTVDFISMDKNTVHVMHGGSWEDDPGTCRGARRDGINADFQDVNLGFRIVYAPERIAPASGSYMPIPR
jgi:formylglycine-generating enzyme required for sulfatase activity